MTYKLSHVLAILVMVSIGSSWLTATVIAQTPEVRAFNRTVYITSGMGSCSGVILQTNLVMTAAHCILDQKTIRVDNREAKVFRKDDDNDLALLLVETIIMERIIVSDLKAGDDIFSWGYPFSSPNRVFTKGYVTVIQLGSSFSTNTAVPGSSGSGLFNKSGHLVGIVTGHMPGTNFSSNRLPEQIKLIWGEL